MTYLGCRDLRDDGVLGKSRTAHEVKERSAILVHPRGSIRHEPLALRGANGRTQIRLRTLAEDAVMLLTLGRVTGDNDVTYGHAGPVSYTHLTLPTIYSV